MEAIQWIIVSLVTVAQIAAIIRSEKALKREISAKDAALTAKDDALRARDAQIEALRELTSVKVREHYQATKAQLEEYIEQLQATINKLQQQMKMQATSGSSEQNKQIDHEVTATWNEIQARVKNWLNNLEHSNEQIARLVKRAYPRAISDSPETRAALKLLGEAPHKGKIEIIYQRDDPEAFRFARSLYMLLLSNRWEVSAPTPIPIDDSDPRPSSVVAGATDTDVTLLAGYLEDCGTNTNSAYCALVTALGGLGLGLHMSRRDELPPDFFRIVVGPKW